MKPSVRGCALRFLDQWFLEEKPLYEGLAPERSKKEQLGTLDKAMSYFKIARNFQTAWDKQKGIPRFQPVLEVLNKQPEGGDDIDAVVRLETELRLEYPDHRLISAASKLTWLRRRDSVIIFDSLVKTSLGLTDVDYKTYCEVWMAQYEDCREKIESVCSKQGDAAKFSVCEFDLDNDEIKRVAREPWFHRRVFDTFHWFRGRYEELD